MSKKSKKDPYRPHVEIRSRESQSASVSVTFPDGKTGIVEFWFGVYPDGRTDAAIHVHCDGGIRVQTYEPKT